MKLIGAACQNHVFAVRTSGAMGHDGSAAPMKMLSSLEVVTNSLMSDIESLSPCSISMEMTSLYDAAPIKSGDYNKFTIVDLRTRWMIMVFATSGRVSFAAGNRIQTMHFRGKGSHRSKRFSMFDFEALGKGDSSEPTQAIMASHKNLRWEPNNLI